MTGTILVSILEGDVLDGLRTLPDACVQCTVTSPPYFGLRNYQTGKWDGGDPDCEHEGNERYYTEKSAAGSSGEAFSEAGASNAERIKKSRWREKGICVKCGARYIDQQIGLEETPEQFIQKMVEVFREVRRVTRPDGVLWLNLGDSYCGYKGDNYCKNTETSNLQSDNHIPVGTISGTPHSSGFKAKDLMGIPWRVAFALQADGWYFRSAIPWIKRNCLSGGTWLYVKSQKGVMPMTVKDLSRLDPESTQLWDGEKWNQVMETFEREIDSRDELYEIELQSGEKIGCTEDHKWPTVRGLIQTKDLIKGDVLKTCTLPDTNVYAAGLPSPDIGWLCGLYLSEGHKSGDSIIFSGNVAETESRYARLSEIISDYQGTIFTTKEIGNGQKVCVSGKVLFGIIDQYIFGKTSKTKHLTRKAWSRDNSFLDALLKGYLQGDGHWDKENSRWRLGFTNNEQLVIDLRVICARLGYSISLRRSYMTAEKGGEKFASWRGEIRMERKVASTIPGTFRPSERTEIVRIGRSRARKVWDIVLKDEPHLYSLASGVLTHNCMPESTTDRPTSAIEYVFLFAKSAKYFYDGEAVRVPATESSVERINQKSFDSQLGGEKDYGKTDINTSRSSRKTLENFKKRCNKQDQTGNPTYTGFNERYKQKNAGRDGGMQTMHRKEAEMGKAYRLELGITRNRRNSDWFFESWQGLYSEAENPLAFIINTQARAEAHFATFPNLLAETCIKAGTSEYGCCPKCGAPWGRIIEAKGGVIGGSWHPHEDDGVTGQVGFKDDGSYRREFKGWQPTCKCGEQERIPCVVLDPFMGSGTVAEVARNLGRSSIGCELNPEYVKIIRKRLKVDSCLDTGIVKYKFKKV